jgi:hypothetical protein
MFNDAFAALLLAVAGHPLVPNCVKIHFDSAVTWDAIPALEEEIKCLVKIRDNKQFDYNTRRNAWWDIKYRVARIVKIKMTINPSGYRWNST